MLPPAKSDIPERLVDVTEAYCEKVILSVLLYTKYLLAPVDAVQLNCIDANVELDKPIVTFVGP